MAATERWPLLQAIQFESKMMLDYEIRDVMNRQRHPKVSAKANFSLHEYDTKANLHFAITNESEIMAVHFAAIIFMPLKWRGTALLPDDDAIFDEVEGMTAFKLVFANSLRSPLFPRSTQYHNFKFHFGRFKEEPNNPLMEIRYRVYADSAPVVTGSFTVDSILQEPSFP